MLLIQKYQDFNTAGQVYNREYGATASFSNLSSANSWHFRYHMLGLMATSFFFSELPMSAFHQWGGFLFPFSTSQLTCLIKDLSVCKMQPPLRGVACRLLACEHISALNRLTGINLAASRQHWPAQSGEHARGTQEVLTITFLRHGADPRHMLTFAEKEGKTSRTSQGHFS